MNRPNIIYTAIIEDEHYGWLPLEVWTRGDVPTTAEGRMLMAARVAAETAESSDDPGLEAWSRWRVHEIHLDDPSKTRDVTTQAIRALVDAANGKGQFPAWWAEHVQLAPEQLDTYDPDDAEDWSPVTLQKELGTY